MSTSKRLREYIDFKGISVTAFEKKTGITNGLIGKAIRNDGILGVDKIGNILLAYKDVNPEWLITGNGPMLKSEGPGGNVEMAKLRARLEAKEGEIDRLIRIIEMITNDATGQVESAVKNKKAG